MLVIGRKEGESIVIADCIEVKVDRAENGNLRIIVDAPREIPIARREIWVADPLKSKEEAVAALRSLQEKILQSGSNPLTKPEQTPSSSTRSRK